MPNTKLQNNTRASQNPHGFHKTNAVNPKGNTYRFAGQENSYDKFRPNWNLKFAKAALYKAGISKLPNNKWMGTPNGNLPVVISIGAGTGADAATFKALGCKVILVEPNKKLLDIAEKNLATIKDGQAEFINANAMDTKVAKKTADLIVVAQARLLKTICARQSKRQQ